MVQASPLVRHGDHRCPGGGQCGRRLSAADKRERCDTSYDKHPDIHLDLPRVSHALSEIHACLSEMREGDVT